MQIPSPTIVDDIALALSIRVPTNATGYRIDFKYHTFEYPQFFCTEYSDQFVAMQLCEAALPRPFLPTMRGAMMALRTRGVWQCGHTTKPRRVCSSKASESANQLSNSCSASQIRE